MIADTIKSARELFDKRADASLASLREKEASPQLIVWRDSAGEYHAESAGRNGARTKIELPPGSEWSAICAHLASQAADQQRRKRAATQPPAPAATPKPNPRRAAMLLLRRELLTMNSDELSTIATNLGMKRNSLASLATHEARVDAIQAQQSKLRGTLSQARRFTMIDDALIHHGPRLTTKWFTDLGPHRNNIAKRTMSDTTTKKKKSTPPTLSPSQVSRILSTVKL